MSDIQLAANLESSSRELIETALARAKRGGADQAEVGMSQDLGLSVSARLRDIETIEFQNDRSFGVTVYVGHCKGSASTSDYSPAAIEQAVDKALYIATQTGADEYAGLADPERLATEFPDLSLDHGWPIDADAARTLALECEAAALDFDARISNSEGASVNTHRSHSAYGNSHGFFATERRSNHSISCAVIAGEGEGMQRDYDYTSARNPAALLDAASVGRRAAEATVARLDPQKLSTRQSPVLFRADVARSLFGHYLSAISGGAQYRRSSFLLDAEGDTLFPAFLNMDEQPWLPAAPASASYDREGVATQPRRLVEAGVIGGYLLSSYSARRLGLESTGNAGGVHNAVVASTHGDLQAMLGEMHEGLLVTELMGQGVNPVTGDYSRGAAGFWVEKGEIAGPVSEITIAGNLKTMFGGIVAVGDDIDRRGAIQTGSVLIDAMTIAGS